MESPFLVEARHITKSFPKVTALEDASLNILPGQIHALLGENGSGKTTLMKILGGLYAAKTYEGEIVIAGKPAVFNSPQDALRHGISIVLRRVSVFEQLNVGENIVVAHWQASHKFLITQQETEQRAQETLDLLGLKLDLSLRARELNSSQKRMLMIARAVSPNPRLVILDEPAAYIRTPAELGQLFRVVRVLSAQNIACLYMTRRPAEVIQIADRVSVLRDGSMVGDFERAEFDESTLSALMASQRIGDYGDGDEDERETPGGLLGALGSLFTFGKRDERD
jgi:ribose transport system ATP-binding protein